MYRAIFISIISLALIAFVCGEEVTVESTNEEGTEPVADTSNAETPNGHYDEFGLYDFTVKNSSGEDYHLGELYGRVALVVNVASKCGYTDAHYKDLVSLQLKFEPTGYFTVLAFPSNQFFEQEPGSMEEILQFATSQYNANFPIFAKVNVTGEYVDEAWQYLTRATGYAPQWNFWKYLVDHNGHVIDVWAHETPASELEGWIEDAISKAMPGGEDHVGGDYNEIVPEESVDFSADEGLHPESESIGINPDHMELWRMIVLNGFLKPVVFSLLLLLAKGFHAYLVSAQYLCL